MFVCLFNRLWIQSILYDMCCPTTVINDLTDVWEDFHEHSKQNLVIVTGGLAWTEEREEYQRSIPKIMTFELSLK